MRTLGKCLFAMIVLAALWATVEAVRVRGVRAEDCEAVRVGLDSVVKRVQDTTDNLALVMGINNGMAMSKVRAFSRIVANDPSVLGDQSRFEALCRPLDVEELHVSDEKGTLIRSVPTSSLGFNLGTADQSRPFMQAISDKSFEFVQLPSVKPTDGKLFQYAGVARLDRPGVVQVGHSAERVAQSQRLADVNAIAKSTRIGRNGRVEIFLRKVGDRPARKWVRDQVVDGVWHYASEADAGQYRVVVRLPVAEFLFADDGWFRVLVGFDVLAFLVLILFCFESVRKLFGKRAVVVPGAAAARVEQLRLRLMNPVSSACAAAFVCAAVVCWLFFSRSSWESAEEALHKAAGDMRGQLDTCVDQQLFFQAGMICRNFGAPEKMTDEIVHETMRRYDIDELNVIDGRGVIVAAADPAEIGFQMASNPDSAAFNCLLEGEDNFSQPFRAAVENPDRRFKYVGVAFPPPARGYVQLGFSEKRLKDGLDYWFGDVAHDWHVGQTGFYVVAKEETGEIDSCGKTDPAGAEVFRRGDTLAGIGFDASSAPRDPNEFFRATIYGEDCLCLSEVRGYHRVVTAMPVAEIAGGSLRTSFAAIGVLFVVFVLVALFMTRLSTLVSSLKGFIADAASRVEKEMAMAKAIQSNVLPATFPPYPKLVDKIDVYARMLTAKEVGGDFYDFYFVGKNRLAVVIADVSGKGVPAALFMMRAKTTLQGLLKGGLAIDEAVGEANSRLAESNEANMFVTAWVGVVDLATGDVEFVNAGHNPPLVQRADGTVSYLTEKSGPPLAAMGGISYRRKEMKLGVGDGLVLYTDGVTEAVNPKLELYGEDRLLATLKGLLGVCGAEALLDGVIGSVQAFANGADQADDITMLAFKLKEI